MNVISRKTIAEAYEKYAETKTQLETWYHDVEKSKWEKPIDIKNKYPSASILPNNMVIFNIKGNKYRLVTKINFTQKTIFIKWFGTHSEYSKKNFG